MVAHGVTTIRLMTGTPLQLVLLDANPLEDVANSQKCAGVMLKGKYYSQAE